MKKSFEVVYRNSGHWDVWGDRARLYRIRGQHGKIQLIGDHIFKNKPDRTFISIQSCMAEIIAEFMND